MAIIFSLTLAWGGIGAIVGVNRASVLPGPQTALRWAALWAVCWPLFLLIERSPGNG